MELLSPVFGSTSQIFLSSLLTEQPSHVRKVIFLPPTSALAGALKERYAPDALGTWQVNGVVKVSAHSTGPCMDIPAGSDEISILFFASEKIGELGITACCLLTIK